MSMGFIKDGEYVQVAGNAEPSGELVIGASTVRKGTMDVTGQDNAIMDFSQTVTFVDPMPDADYEVTLSNNSPSWHISYTVKSKTKNGFVLQGLTLPAGGGPMPEFKTFTLSYTAFKLIEKEDIQDLTDNVEAIDSKISELATSTNKLVSKSELADTIAAHDNKIGLCYGSSTRPLNTAGWTNGTCTIPSLPKGRYLIKVSNSLMDGSMRLVISTVAGIGTHATTNITGDIFNDEGVVGVYIQNATGSVSFTVSCYVGYNVTAIQGSVGLTAICIA